MQSEPDCTIVFSSWSLNIFIKFFFQRYVEEQYLNICLYFVSGMSSSLWVCPVINGDYLKKDFGKSSMGFFVITVPRFLKECWHNFSASWKGQFCFLGIGRQNFAHGISFELWTHWDSDLRNFLWARLTRTHTHRNFLLLDSLGLKLTKTLLTRAHSDSWLDLSLSDSEWVDSWVRQPRIGLLSQGDNAF